MPQHMPKFFPQSNKSPSACHNNFITFLKTVRYCSSNRNQRIECFWSSLRKGRASWWINFFKDLVDRGNYNPEYPLQKECMWFCFSTTIQKDLDNFRHEWNTHYIRKSRHDTIPGRPDSLYFLPERVGYQSQVRNIQEDHVTHMDEFVREYEEGEDLAIYKDYFEYLIVNTDLEQPNTWQEALYNYYQMLQMALGGANN